MACGEEKCFRDSVTPLSQNNLPSLRRQVYEGLIAHYGDIPLTKIPSPDPRFSMYGAEVPCLCAEKRYLFAITPADSGAYGATALLSQLNWSSFQARTSAEPYPVNQVSYSVERTGFGSIPIHQIREDETYTWYQVQGYPIHVQLINGRRAYSTQGTIRDALETFETILYFA